MPGQHQSVLHRFNNFSRSSILQAPNASTHLNGKQGTGKTTGLSTKACVDLIPETWCMEKSICTKGLAVSNCLKPGTFALYILISMELITYVEVPVSSFTVPSDKYANRYKQGGIPLSA